MPSAWRCRGSSGFKGRDNRGTSPEWCPKGGLPLLRNSTEDNLTVRQWATPAVVGFGQGVGRAPAGSRRGTGSIAWVVVCIRPG